jgi:hypothetical protein
MVIETNPGTELINVTLPPNPQTEITRPAVDQIEGVFQSRDEYTPELIELSKREEPPLVAMSGLATFDIPAPENQAIAEGIRTFIREVEEVLDKTTGHNDYDKHKIAYYIAATYHTPQCDAFPCLATFGPPSSGKSATLSIVKARCFKPILITSNSITPAALKNAMTEANNGTLIIEEADGISTRHLEDLLISRYLRDSATVKKMESSGKDWKGQTYSSFGATILHRRNLFRDLALLRRTIKVRTKRLRKEFIPVKLALGNLPFIPPTPIASLPEIQNKWDIEPGIFDCYRPLLSIAWYLQDKTFINQLADEMANESQQLLKEENYLEAPTILNALINLVVDKLKDVPNSKRIGIPISDINKVIREEYGSDCPTLMLSANQRNRIIEEDLGFPIKSANGRVRVYLDIPFLMQRCEQYNVTDEVFAVWRESLKQQES